VIVPEILIAGAVFEHVIEIAVRMEAATAPMAFLAPRRERMRWNWVWM
jgi:hypothetical protein